MTKELETGGPMFPTKVSINRDTDEFIPHQFGNNDFVVPGGSIRIYAAIHLRVPMSEARGIAHWPGCGARRRG